MLSVVCCTFRLLIVITTITTLLIAYALAHEKQRQDKIRSDRDDRITKRCY
jgi:hypothetical protein